MTRQARFLLPLFSAAFLFGGNGAFADPASGGAATSFPEKLYVPGAYQNWKPGSAPVITAVPGSPGIYKGSVNMSGAGPQPFKFTDAPDWTHTNYGEGGGGKLNPDGKADGLTLPDGGNYELTVDLNKNTWTSVKAAGVTAAASSPIASVAQAVPSAPAAQTATSTGAFPQKLFVPGAYQNWKPDVAPVISAVPGSPGLYKGTVNMTGTGPQPFKFTDAPDWTHTNYGDGGNGKLNPDGKADGVSLPEGGNYDLTVDLNKNTWTASKVGGAVPSPGPAAASTTGATSTAAETSTTAPAGSFPQKLYVPGAYQNWKPDSAPVINPVPGSPGLYEGYVNMAGAGAQRFKLTDAPDWMHTNYGDGGSGKLNPDGKAEGLSAADGGYYEVTADLNKNTWTATKTTWGIIGDSTPGGWNTDTALTYDATKQVWAGAVALKQSGSFKFRANGAWKIDFGIDDAGNLQYADNAFFTYNPKLKQLTVPVDGNYTITLDLHVSGNYTYSVIKN